MIVGLIRIEKWNSKRIFSSINESKAACIGINESINKLKKCNKTMLKICKTEQWNECMSNNDHMLREGNEMDRCSSSTEADG